MNPAKETLTSIYYQKQGDAPMSIEQQAAMELMKVCTPPKTLREFVRENRPTITACMKKWIPDLRPKDTDRINWVTKIKPSSKCWKKVACNKVCLKYKEFYEKQKTL